MDKTAYEILGINETATEVEVKKAYHALLNLYHTDNATGNKEKVTDVILAYKQVMKKINQEKRNNLSAEELIDRELDIYKTYNGYESLKDSIAKIKEQYIINIEANPDKRETFIKVLHERIEELFSENLKMQNTSVEELVENETLQYELEDDYEYLKDNIAKIKEQYINNINANPDKRNIFINALHERIEELFTDYRNFIQNTNASELVDRETLQYELEDEYEYLKESINEIKTKYIKFMEANPSIKNKFIETMRERIESLFAEYRKRINVVNELRNSNLEPEDRELLEGIYDNILNYDEIYQELYEKYILNNNNNNMAEETKEDSIGRTI